MKKSKGEMRGTEMTGCIILYQNITKCVGYYLLMQKFASYNDFNDFNSKITNNKKDGERVGIGLKL